MSAWSSCTLTSVLPHRNSMLQIQGMPPHPTPSQYTDTGLTSRDIHWRVTSHSNTILMFWVRPDLEILPDLPHMQQKLNLEAVVVVVSRKLGRRCTVHGESWFRDLRCANPLRFPIAYSGFVFVLFVLGLTSLWNIWGHITTVSACNSGTLTNVLPHRNAMPQTQDTTPHPVTVYRHGANLSLCYPSMRNVTLEYTAETRPGNPSPTFHTHQRTFNLMLSWWSTVGSSVESTVPTGSWTRDLWCANPVRYPLAHSDFLA